MTIGCHAGLAATALDNFKPRTNSNLCNWLAESSENHSRIIAGTLTLMQA